MIRILLTLLSILPQLALSQSGEGISGGEKRSASSERSNVNLHSVSLERVQKVSGLDRIRCIRLLEYRRKHGPIRSFYELHYLEGFDNSVIERLRSSTFLGALKEADSLNIKESLKRLEGRFRLRWGRLLQRRRGYRNGSYIGPPSSIKGNLRLETPGLATIGGSIEKDAGEAWWGSAEQGSNGLDAYLKLHSRAFLEKLIIGPLEARSGGGILFDNGTGFGQRVAPSQGPLFGLNAHTGSPDRSSLRGVAAEFRHKGFRSVLLYSRKKWTARTDTLPGGDKVLRTLYRNGIRREKRLVERSGKWTRRDMLAQVGWKEKGMAIGGSFHYGSASLPSKPPERVRDRAEDTGRKEKGMEIHWRKSRGRTKASFSFSMEEDHSYSFSGAISARPYEDIHFRGRIEGAGWGYDPFRSPIARDGRPFIRVLTGADRLLASGWRIGINSSLLRVKWPHFGRKGPGTERSIAFETIRTGEGKGRAELEIEYNSEDKDLGSENSRGTPSERERGTSIAFRSTLPLSRRIESRIRIRHKRILGSEAKPGMLFAHDLIAEPKDPALKIYWRWALFDAPNYDTRPYAYENDLLYAFSVRSYYRTGLRSYLLMRFDPIEDLTVEGKVGTWAFRDIDEIGSGDGAIPGRYRSRIRIQVRGNF